MAKKEDLKQSFVSKRKKKISAEEIDKIAEQVHEPSKVEQGASSAPAVSPNESVDTVAEPVFIKTSVDFPEDMYTDMKIMLIRRKQSMKEYILSMVRADLYGS